MNIFRRDLNLLLLFHVLYKERNASRAAELLSNFRHNRNQQYDPNFHAYFSCKYPTHVMTLF